MNRAFIFDVDGTLIDDEAIWEDKKQELYARLFGESIRAKMGSTLGVNIDGIYERARKYKTTVSKEAFIKEFYKLAAGIYSTAPIPEGTDELLEYLVEEDFRIAVVSASPLSWGNTVLQRLKFQDDIELVISLYDRPDLDHKPHPAGYLEAMRAMDVVPENTFILEDSNSGIASATSSGAYTIGLKKNLVGDYKQEGADIYAETMANIIHIVKNYLG